MSRHREHVQARWTWTLADYVQCSHMYMYMYIVQHGIPWLDGTITGWTEQLILTNNCFIRPKYTSFFQFSGLHTGTNTELDVPFDHHEQWNYLNPRCFDDATLCNFQISDPRDCPVSLSQREGTIIMPRDELFCHVCGVFKKKFCLSILPVKS